MFFSDNNKPCHRKLSLKEARGQRLGFGRGSKISMHDLAFRLVLWKQLSFRDYRPFRFFFFLFCILHRGLFSTGCLILRTTVHGGIILTSLNRDSRCLKINLEKY